MSNNWVSFCRNFLSFIGNTESFIKSKQPSWKETNREFRKSLRDLQEKIAKVSSMIDDTVFEEVDKNVPSGRQSTSRGYGVKNSQKSY